MITVMMMSSCARLDKSQQVVPCKLEPDAYMQREVELDLVGLCLAKNTSISVMGQGIFGAISESGSASESLPKA